MARVVLARSARLELLHLDWALVNAIENAFGLLECKPTAGHPLRGRLRGLRSLRLGSYRIVYQLASEDRPVRVVAICHHAIAYRSDLR